MQKSNLIPTPLLSDTQSKKRIDIAEPTLPRQRFLRMMFFLWGMVLRSLLSRIFPRLNRKLGPGQRGRRLREFMEKMGGLWVKTGQIIALRRDLFAEEFCAEVAKLQDRSRGFPFHYARETIEAELGQPLEAVFAEFSEEPLAAASIGQAYRARLRVPDVEVVVKVRRPNIEQSFAVDLRYLRNYCRLLIWLGVAANFRWNEMYWEIEHAILEELDYRQEAASLRRARKNLRAHKIYVPKVFTAHCTDRVLVMELVRGVYMSDYIRTAVVNPEQLREWRRENQISARKMGQRLLFSSWRQIFEDNLYHCDLHPGNILLMRRNRAALIDFGSVGTTDKTQLSRFLHLNRAFASRDYQKIADIHLLLPPSLPSKDLSSVKEHIVRQYREFEQRMKIKDLPYHEKSQGRIAAEVTKVMGEAQISASWDFLRQMRAQLTLDASLMFLMPQVNYQKMVQRYLYARRQRQTKKFQSAKQTRARLARLSDAAEVPATLAENAYFEGEYLRRRALKYEGYLSKSSQVGRYVLLGISGKLVLAALAIIAVGLHQRYHILRGLSGTWISSLLERLPHLEPVIWILAAIAIFYVSRECVAMSHVLEEAEPSRAGGDRR